MPHPSICLEVLLRIMKKIIRMDDQKINQAASQPTNQLKSQLANQPGFILYNHFRHNPFP